MSSIIKFTSLLFAALLFVSVCVFAEDSGATDSISFESGTDKASETALKNIKITSNGSFDEEDLRRCREVIGLTMLENTDDMDIKKYSGLDLITIGDSITMYREENFVYIVADPSPGMNQLCGYELVSKDGGESWILNQFHRVRETGDMYIIEGNIVYVDGIGMEEISIPVISSDCGKTYKEPDITAIENLMSLPSMDGCSCYAKVRAIDLDDKTITFDWYMTNPENPGDTCCFYRTKLSCPSFKTVGKSDMSGLADEVAKYKKSGYLFENSDSGKLNRTSVSARFLKEYRLAGAEKTAAEIRTAVNEIYARKGQEFKSEEVRAYFDGRKWYKPVEQKVVTEKDLNEFEAYNIKILEALEKEYKAASIE